MAIYPYDVKTGHALCPRRRILSTSHLIDRARPDSWRERRRASLRPSYRSATTTQGQ
jgi:hypothetical protein